MGLKLNSVHLYKLLFRKFFFHIIKPNYFLCDTEILRGGNHELHGLVGFAIVVKRDKRDFLFQCEEFVGRRGTTT